MADRVDKIDLLKCACAVEAAILGITGRHSESVPTVTVLMYHGVLDDVRADNQPRLSKFNITQSAFANQIRYLGNHCNVISTDDLLCGRNLSRRRRNVVITFDDGYRNNFLNAYPLLRQAGLPALVSITTGFVQDQKPLWNDILEWAIRKSRLDHCEVTFNNIHTHASLATPAARTDFYNWAMHTTVGIDQSQRTLFIDAIVAALKVAIDTEKIMADPDFAPLVVADIKQLGADDRIEIASHSVSHFNLTKLNTPQLSREIAGSREIIENMTGRPCRVFCFPGGNYNQTCLQMLAASGYRIGMTSELATYAYRPGKALKRMGRFCITTRHGDMSLFRDLIDGYLIKSYYKVRKLAGSYRKRLRA